MIKLNPSYHIVLTSHAIERAKQFSLSIPEVVEKFRAGQPEAMDKEMRTYKNNKYDNTKVFQWRSDTFIFVAKEDIHKVTQRPIYLIITLTNQLIHLDRLDDNNIL